MWAFFYLGKAWKRKKHNWDFETALKYKHEYNKTREYRHGGKAI
jgi:hypothetical protein